MAAKRTQLEKKRCARPGCGLKPLSDFPINRGLAGGRAAYCRACKRLNERERKSAGAGPKLSASKPEVLTDPTKEKPRKGARGPASTITADLIKRLCVPLRRGHTRRAAARKCGVLEDTFAQWMKRGAEETSGAAVDLYRAVVEAEGVGEHSLLEKVREAAEVDPLQARWILERRFSQGAETWVRKEHIDVPGGPEMPEVSVVRELLFSRLKGLGGGGPHPVAPVTGGGDRPPPAAGENAGGTREAAAPPPDSGAPA